MKKSCLKFTATAAALLIGLLLFGLFMVIYLAPNYTRVLDDKRNLSNQVMLDRHGRVIRIAPDEHGEYMIWLRHDLIPQLMKNAVIAAEDKRFYSHFGFDPVATTRAIYNNYASGKIVSGASTISQQVVRMVTPRPRTLRSKFIEFFAALKLEWQLSKEEILELNLNLAPMGGYLKGVGIASLVYFDKDLKMLSVSEAASLAALPRSPSRFDPSRTQGYALLMKEKDSIIDRMLRSGFISAEESNTSRGKTVKFRKRNLPREASHFTALALKRIRSNRQIVTTTLDIGIQKNLEQILLSHRSRLNGRGIKQASAIIVSVRDLEVLALAGSIRYGPTHGGYNNGAMAPRSAGSTLKPFLYATALAKGFSANSVIPDTARNYKTPAGDYTPLNANRTEYGPVTMPEALGSSLNLAAVKTIEKVGLSDFYNFLERINLVDGRSKNFQHYGYGLAIGNLETSLFNLTQAYGCLARQGKFGKLRLLLDEPMSLVRVLEPELVTGITEILADHNSRIPAFGNPHYFDFGFPVALKTGTSDGHRDAWVIAYTEGHVIGIWAGNFDGKPSFGASGAEACGPVLKDIISGLGGSASVNQSSAGHGPFVLRHADRDSVYTYLGAEYAKWVYKREMQFGLNRFRLKIPHVIDDVSNDLKDSVGVKVPSKVQDGQRSRISIISPHDQDRFSRPLDRTLIIPLKAAPSEMVPYVVWIIDGVEVARTGAPYEFMWRPDGGAHSILAVTPEHEAAKIEIRVE